MKRLTKFTRYKGNAYYAGTYEDGYLPDALLSQPGLVIDLNTNQDQTVEVNVDNQFRLNQQSIDIGSAEKSTNTELTFKDGAEVVNVEDDKTKVEPKTETEKGKQKTDDKKLINLNTATIEELSKISTFVTIAVAQNIVKVRAEKKIENVEDLNSRVALKGKNNWESVSEKIEF